MNYTKCFRAASAALLITIAILLLASGASAAGKFKTLHKFTGTDGSNPNNAGLIFDKAGNLYGTTITGGNLSCDSPQGCGTIFKLAPNSDGSWTRSVLYSFTGGKDGITPDGGLIMDSAGNLYGTTGEGGIGRCNGAGGCGTVFELIANADGTWTESVLYRFTAGKDGGAPSAGLIFDQAGNLYGTTTIGGNLGKCNTYGCGVVFELTPNANGTWTETTLYDFCALSKCADGSEVRSGLVFDQIGNLYGTTVEGGNHGGSCGHYGCGVVFKLTANADGSWTQSVLHRAGSTGGLILDAAGNLYGTIAGTISELTPNSDGSWTNKVLHHFTGGKDGAGPMASLIFDQAGNLYGTTYGGGTYGFGIVFKLTPNSKGGWTETVLHAFADKPGAYLESGLILDGAGNLYGTTDGDRSTTYGSVFEITP